ncbi:hypothetical protein [Aliivibrio fischeri]|uniref:hypothetical protein n=1 Tax=Aliivibrio fischeri TaxID=668 RepID=UPI001F1887F9|nr:hypothetical protein [Aliivibrio fischeri]MCE7536795.1 hypothetical protein [Aliivibrio fischeri]MCE7560489.1 hypothetical protein [Aliivibrio fischeri]
MKIKYIISSGWWCNGDDEDTREKLLGDDLIREKDFFSNWFEAINLFTNPEKIIVVDSNSPVKPDLSVADDRVEFISLDENAGHSTNHTGQYCGYTRAIFAGMGYAISCNVDYWVYVEQDALLYGDNIVENAISEMQGDFLFGSGEGTPQVLQQSLIIMKTAFLPTFIKNYTDINYTDNQISPELKFALSCSPYYKIISKVMFIKTKIKSIDKFIMRLSNFYFKYLINKNSFNFGYGRARPIDFDEQFFYFQHGDKNELNMYAEKMKK